MGQYWVVANMDRREFLDPHKFYDGAKFMEFGASGDGTMLGLAALLAEPGVNGRGGGDLDSKKKIVGSWFGDSIVIVGDYGDPFPEDDQEPKRNLYRIALDEFSDVSTDVIEALLDDHYFKQDYAERSKAHGDVA